MMPKLSSFSLNLGTSIRSRDDASSDERSHDADGDTWPNTRWLLPEEPGASKVESEYRGPERDKERGLAGAGRTIVVFLAAIGVEANAMLAGTFDCEAVRRAGDGCEARRATYNLSGFVSARRSHGRTQASAWPV